MVIFENLGAQAQEAGVTHSPHHIVSSPHPPPRNARSHQACVACIGISGIGKSALSFLLLVSLLLLTSLFFFLFSSVPLLFSSLLFYPLLLSLFSSPLHQTQANIFNVVDFGAVGDGKTLDTAAITKAITAVTDAGWGTVMFPVCNEER